MWFFNKAPWLTAAGLLIGSAAHVIPLTSKSVTVRSGSSSNAEKSNAAN